MADTSIDPRRAPPTAADELTMLSAWLDWHRGTVHHKCAGLDPALAGRSPVASSPLMSVGGIVAHLRWVEHYWFEVVLLGLPDRGPYHAGDPDAEWRIGAEGPLPALLDAYAAQCARSREITGRLELNSAARRRPAGGSPVTLRWVLMHLLTETARHNGHLDIVRESADGVTGE
ncbi:DinB family protein [Marinactinospora rubrisoli]|uniref:DinB family protein n=1 Tax=Marinactinospora rubrisoli TaxID=2715399 RepID=A0ABW2KEK9_9ACTN